MTRSIALVLSIAASLQGCGGGPPPPAPVDTRNDACAWCRMAVSDTGFAAQIVAPAEEPRFFDDIGCLRSYLGGGAKVPAGAVAYVADHRTREWVRAARAVYTRVPGLATPMASGLVAHADESSRATDPVAAAAAPLGVRDVFGAAGPPDGGP